MIYRLIAKKPEPDQLVLSFGWGSRVFFGVLGLIIAYGMVQEGSVGIFALIITIVLFLAAVYLDRWVFDRKTGEIAHSSGLLFLHRTKRYPLADLEEVLFQGHLPADSPPEPEPVGRMHSRRAFKPGMARLRLRFAESGEADVQMEPNRNANELHSLGLEIAGFCDVPYRDGG